MSKRLKTRLSITNQTRTATTDVSRVVLGPAPGPDVPCPAVRVSAARGHARPYAPGGPRPRRHVLEIDFREPPRPGRRTCDRRHAVHGRPAPARPPQRRKCPAPRARRPGAPGAGSRARSPHRPLRTPNGRAAATRAQATARGARRRTATGRRTAHTRRSTPTVLVCPKGEWSTILHAYKGLTLHLRPVWELNGDLRRVRLLECFES